MVSFRKSLLLVGLLVLVAGLASAQIPQPLTCTANAGVPPLARAEGLAEEVGQAVIECRGGVRAAQDTLLPTINVQIFLNTNLTSRLFSTGSEALLLVDDPAPAAQRLCIDVTAGCPARASYAGGDSLAGAEHTYSGTAYTSVGITYPAHNVFRAIHGRQTVTGLENSATFLGVPFNPPGTAGVRTLRIANVRANASQQAVLGAFGLPGSIQMVISISGTASLPLANPQLTVAFVQPGLLFTSTTGTFNQCDRPSGSVTGSSYFIDATFQERFGTAFRTRGTDTQNIPGAIYNTESMFTNTALDTQAGVTGIGRATQPTQLRLAISGIPTGVSIGLTAAPPTPPNALTVSGVPAAALSISGGAATATLAVETANPNVIESLVVRVHVWWTTPPPGIGTATVRGDYAPQSTVNVATTGDAVPRFLPSTVTAGTFTIIPCQTNLLFPFVSNQAGFDTGLVISNTSLDPYGTVPQEGTCRIWYYGTTAAGATLNEWVDTATVAAGRQHVWLLSTSTPGAGFQGYVITRCNFQYAHGFAFVSDLGAQRLAMGYLALVLDGQKTYITPGQVTRTNVRSETLGQ